MKYKIVSSYPEVSGDELDITNEMLNWINDSGMYTHPDIDLNTDLTFEPFYSKGGEKGTFLTPKGELPKVEPIEIPEYKGDSTISFDDPKSFVDSFYNVYINRGVKPELAQVLAVQKLLESRNSDGSGFTVLAKEFNNFGGIKASKGVSDYYTSETDEYENGVKKRIVDKFRKFDDIDDYLDYESKYIYGDRGNFNGALSGDIENYFNTILGGRLKYATSPYYRGTLEDLRNQYFGVKGAKKGGILKMQAAGKFVPDIGDATRIVNWDGIDLTGERSYNPEYIDYIYNGLLDKGYDLDTAAIIIGNILDESGGDPYSKSGKFKGLLQWANDRYNIKDFSDPYKEIDNQIDYLHSTIDNIDDGVSWTHGGDNSGYVRGYNARDVFKSDTDLYKRHHAFSFGYVRPYKEYTDRIAAANNRFKIVEQVLERIK